MNCVAGSDAEEKNTGYDDAVLAWQPEVILVARGCDEKRLIDLESDDPLRMALYCHKLSPCLIERGWDILRVFAESAGVHSAATHRQARQETISFHQTRTERAVVASAGHGHLHIPQQDRGLDIVTDTSRNLSNSASQRRKAQRAICCCSTRLSDDSKSAEMFVKDYAWSEGE